MDDRWSLPECPSVHWGEWSECVAHSPWCPRPRDRPRGRTRARRSGCCPRRRPAARARRGTADAARGADRQRRRSSSAAASTRWTCIHAPAGRPGSSSGARAACSRPRRPTSLGGYLFRNVDAGTGYTRRAITGDRVSPSRAGHGVSTRTEMPPQSLYSGQKLAGEQPDARPPATATSPPATARSSRSRSCCPARPTRARTPRSSSTRATTRRARPPASRSTSCSRRRSAYAWVGVNIRGTGCSGGAYNFFENLQALDGYDAIETVAAQPWSTGRVGMVGISFAGISQLFVARTQPPHLDAITPLSVIDDTWRGTLYPGGIYNDGFAKSWAERAARAEQVAEPERAGLGQDPHRRRRHHLRRQHAAARPERRPARPDRQAPVLTPRSTRSSATTSPNGGDSLAPQAFVKDIKAPVFIAGAWQDEQTGGHWANLLDRFSPDTQVRAVGQNGVHTESLDPAVLRRARRVPRLLRRARRSRRSRRRCASFAPLIWSVDHRRQRHARCRPTASTRRQTYDQALAQFEADPKVGIHWEIGNAAGVDPRRAGARARRPGTRRGRSRRRAPTAWYLQPGRRPAARSPRRPRRAVGPTTTRRPDGPAADELHRAATSGTRPRPTTGSRSSTASRSSYITSAADQDRLDGRHRQRRPLGRRRPRPTRPPGDAERGAARRHRALRAERLAPAQPPQARPGTSTAIDPFHTDPRPTTRPVPRAGSCRRGSQIFPFAYSFRAGSRIRLTIEAPGGDRPQWTFDTPATGGQVIDHDRPRPRHPSRVVLPVLPANPTLRPTPAPCPSLRAQPCRTYVAPAAPLIG